MDTVKIKIDDLGYMIYPKNVKLIDVSKDIKSSREILGAKINNTVVNLATPITKDCVVQFIDLYDLAGYKIYQNGLKFIFQVALHELYPDLSVSFEHSVPKGVLAEVSGGLMLTDQEISQIKGKMVEIIDSNYKFEKFNIEKNEMIDFYYKNNETEKARNIEKMTDDVVRIFKLKDVLNYFYSEMPYSTGVIKKFDLVYLGNNRIVFLFPSVRTEGKVPEYVHYENIIKAFADGKSFLKSRGINYIADLNDKVCNCTISPFIETCEILFNKHITTVVDNILQDPQKKVILFAGPSSSGKTTTMKRFSSYFRAKGFKTVEISVDDYFVDREKSPKNEKGEYDYECLMAIDIEQFNKDINDLLQGKEIDLPVYDFVSGKRRYENKKRKLEENSVILIEGLHTLNDALTPGIDSKYKYKIYLSPFLPINVDRHNYVSTTDLRLLRRIIRDNRTRGVNINETFRMWQNVREGEEKYIFPYVHQADIIFNTSFAYELGVMRVFVEPILYSVKPGSEYYEEAIRLIKGLKNYMAIPPEYIGDGSILREFIGYGLWKGR